MSWTKENKFLTGFLGAMVVATGGLGFMLMSASGRYSQALASYEDQSRELRTLQTRAPYPDQDNLDKMKVQAKEQQDAIEALQKSLIASQVPLEPITPVEFQDKLKEAVARVIAKAGAKPALPEKFYLGFDPYQFEPPKPEAAPLLARQLKALEAVVTQLIEKRVDSLNRFDRVPLPEEGAEKLKTTKPGDKSSDTKSGAKSLVAKNAVTIEFTGDQANFRGFLNSLVASKTQFFIPRKIDIKNEELVGPPKVDPNAAQSLPPPVDPSAAALPEGAAAPADGATAPLAPKRDLGKYVVGDEKITVVMNLEVVDFADVSSK